MPYTATITSQGQLTVPKPIRDIFGLLPSTKISFIEKDKQVIIKPVTDFMSLKGSIKNKKKYFDKNANQAVLRALKKKYE